jgi:transcription elongation factor SPT6
MQLATSSLAQTTSLSIHQALSENELDEAAAWILPRLGPQKEDDFFRANGRFFHLLRDLVTAITSALRFLFIGQLEVPHIWVHKRDHLSYFNEKDMRVTVELLSLQDLWRVYTVGQRYRALLDRRTALDALHNRFGVSDDYYENEIRKKIETVEGVSDATEWLNMKYKSSKQDFFGSALQTDGALEDRKHKLPSRISAYEVARRSIVSKLADVCATACTLQCQYSTHCRRTESGRTMLSSTMSLIASCTSLTITS